MTPREEDTAAAGHTTITITMLQLCYCRTQETPRAPEPEEKRRDRERHQKDRRAPKMVVTQMGLTRVMCNTQYPFGFYRG